METDWGHLVTLKARPWEHRRVWPALAHGGAAAELGRDASRQSANAAAAASSGRALG